MSTIPETPTNQTTTPVDPAKTVSLSPTAAEQVRSIQANEKLEEHVLRISVVGGGCSGMSYRMGFVEAPTENDRVIEVEGVSLVVDPKSFLYLKGTVVDFHDGLNGKGFTFINPKAKKTCGCGSSFSA